MRLLSSGEDRSVKVWDLVLNKEVASLKENQGRVSCFAFTNDQKTLFVGARDGKIALYNTLEQFKLITTLTPLENEDDEVTALMYHKVSEARSYLLVGNSTGQLMAIDLQT
jgi:WD40 repeat protein